MILDVTDPSNPQEIGASQPFEGQILDIAVAENYAYLSTGTSGLYIVNISDPSQPAVVGQYDTPGYAEGVIVQKDNAFIADGPGGMSISKHCQTLPNQRLCRYLIPKTISMTSC